MYKLGQYVHRDGITYRLDPRTKIISVMVLSALIFVANVLSAAFISAFIVFAIFLSRLMINHVLRALKPLAIFMCLLFVLHVFLTDGEALYTFSFFPMEITYEGLYRGAFVTWQIACLVLAGAVLTMTTPPSELINGIGIESLLRPLRPVGVPSHDVAMMISMALRFMPTLLEEYDRIRTAQTARGADIKKGSFSEKLKLARALSIPLVFSVFRRADELVDAMEARAYQRGHRTSLRELRTTSCDLAALALILLLAGSVLFSTGIFG